MRDRRAEVILKCSTGVPPSGRRRRLSLPLIIRSLPFPTIVSIKLRVVAYLIALPVLSVYISVHAFLYFLYFLPVDSRI